MASIVDDIFVCNCQQIYLSNFYVHRMLYIFSAGDIPITSCAGSTRYGSYTNIDFTKINRPCTCTVVPSFVGQLIVITKPVTVQECNTQITVDKNIVFRCSASTDPLISTGINVQINQSVVVRAEYLHKSPSISGTFHHCLGFQQNGKYAF